MTTATVQKRNMSSKPHPTPAERAARGREARAQVPRSSHAAWDPPTDRLDPVAILEAQAPSRVAELVPIRYGRMLTSPFAFYRGAAAIMAYDLSATPKTGDPGAGLWRRAHLELRGLRLAGAIAAVRRERLRRDRPGAVGVGPEAAGRQHRDRRARQRVLGHGAPGRDATRRRQLPDRDGLVRIDARPRRVVLAPRDPGRPAARAQEPGQAERQDGDGDRRQGEDEGQHAGLRAPHEDGRRTSDASPAIHP